MKKLLIYIINYNTEKFVKNTFQRINKKIFENYETEILISDDSSTDKTLEEIKSIKETNANKIKITILSNPKNLGYGGNQKIGYYYAIENNFDYVALLHGDGQYAPELLNDLVLSLEKEKAQAVFGSRMISKFGALKGGMPFYKFVGNKILSYLQNKLLNSNLSEFHSGYRVYDVKALKKIPFNLNSNDYSFDTEIIIQLLFSNFKIFEISIPTYYGEEISYLNGIPYAFRVMKESVKARLQRYEIFYDKKYDLFNEENKYKFKNNFFSTHTYAIDNINNNSLVLDIGCNKGELGQYLIKTKNCEVYGIDENEKLIFTKLNKYISFDLNSGLPDLDYKQIDYVVLLDVIEHLKDPERFLLNLYDKFSENEKVEILISTPNVSFFIIRFMLLFGFFNYGKRGILDKTHTRLFTFQTFRNLVKSHNFQIINEKGIPAPFPLALGNNFFGNFFLNFNKILISLWKSFFSYQIFFIIKPNASLNLLLKKAKKKAISTT